MYLIICNINCGVCEYSVAAPRIQALARSRLMAQTGTGSSTREYALLLASDKTTVFARSIDNFVCCTVESKEINPSVVMRNVRQFMSGMKNYLLKHGEKEFQKVVEKERSQVIKNYSHINFWIKLK